ncbi:UNVERIFIED_CONTAM: hypothetical protein FKN15_045276 [Acipenser sinensis]
MASAAKAPVIKIQQDKLLRTITYREADKLVWAEWANQRQEKPFFHPGSSNMSQPLEYFVQFWSPLYSFKLSGERL